MRADLQIDIGDSRKATAVYVALNADKRVSERSKMECRVDGGSLFMSIDATDAVALRSALNGQLRVIDSCLSCLDVK